MSSPEDLTPSKLSQSRTDLLSSAQNWTWEQLRDYVIRQIESIHGPQPRNLMKEAAIFKAHKKRWAEQSGPIARFAFDIEKGYWQNAPVTISRFARGSDPYFSVPISERL